MSFVSIVFNNKIESSQNLPEKEPEVFSDLNLDQIVNEITSQWSEYNLKPFFYFPLNSKNEIYYRHSIFRDLEDEKVYEQINLFAGQMRKVRKYLKQVEKFYYEEQKQIWFLYAVEIYCDAVENFKEELSISSIKSEGLIKIKDYLKEYCSGVNFNSINDEIKKIKTDLSKVKYQIIIQEGSFTVQNYEEGIDYSKEIERTFGKFKIGAVNDYKKNYTFAPAEMNHIEAKIVEFVSFLYPEIFSGLKNFGKNHSQFIDETISSYDREIHFYISYTEYLKKFKQEGLIFCYPVISNLSKEICDYEAFDLALAQKLLVEKSKIVCNDFSLNSEERIIVVTGPNQGGKTTFARMFGQLHYLTSIGCPVPGNTAKLYLTDNIYTQFERIEKVENLRGKLEDDLKSVYSVLERATSQSIIIMNEIFNSTTLQDMTFLSKKILEKITKLDAICVWVTFVDELTEFNGKIVSMTSMIVPENPALRTFKILRRPANGLAYAMAIAEKYKLKENQIKERIKQ